MKYQKIIKNKSNNTEYFYKSNIFQTTKYFDLNAFMLNEYLFGKTKKHPIRTNRELFEMTTKIF
jgi:hypothetical protein